MARWPCDLGRPVNPLDATVQMRAQSILTERGAPGPLLPIDQARDVVRWHESQLLTQQRDSLGFRLRRMFRNLTNRKEPQQ